MFGHIPELCCSMYDTLRSSLGIPRICHSFCIVHRRNRVGSFGVLYKNVVPPHLEHFLPDPEQPGQFIDPVPFPEQFVYALPFTLVLPPTPSKTIMYQL